MDHFETELDTLKRRLMDMANCATAAVSRALQALQARDESLALQVKESDRVIDRLELEIDDLGIQQLTKAPLAGDLRLITVATKIAHNLERVGDEAAKIARRAADLSREPELAVQLASLPWPALRWTCLKPLLTLLVIATLHWLAVFYPGTRKWICSTHKTTVSWRNLW